MAHPSNHNTRQPKMTAIKAILFLIHDDDNNDGDNDDDDDDDYDYY